MDKIVADEVHLIANTDRAVTAVTDPFAVALAAALPEMAAFKGPFRGSAAKSEITTEGMEALMELELLE